MIKENLNAPVHMMVQAMDSVNIKDESVYADFLAQTYYYVAHSTRLLALAAGLLSKEDEKYFRRFVRHIGEETSHEVLAEKDLKDLGHSPEDFYHKPETKALWEPQYYKILREDPMGFMGYILVLEQFACVRLDSLLKDVESAYEGKAKRFIKLHAEEDPDHVDKAIIFSESLSTERQKLVVMNMYQTATAYSQLLKSCGDKVLLNFDAKNMPSQTL